MANESKVIRGQLRQIAKELLPEALTQEVIAKMEKITREKLDIIHEMVRDTLKAIDDRQKDTISMLMREMTRAPVNTAETQASEPPVETV